MSAKQRLLTENLLVQKDNSNTVQVLIFLIALIWTEGQEPIEQAAHHKQNEVYH